MWIRKGYCEKKKINEEFEIYSVSSSTTESLLNKNCPTEDPENHHDGRSLQLTLSDFYKTQENEEIR